MSGHFQACLCPLDWVCLTGHLDVSSRVFSNKTRSFLTTHQDISPPCLWQPNHIFSDEMLGHFPAVLMVTNLGIFNKTWGRLQLCKKNYIFLMILLVGSDQRNISSSVTSQKKLAFFNKTWDISSRISGEKNGPFESKRDLFQEMSQHKWNHKKCKALLYPWHLVIYISNTHPGDWTAFFSPPH